MNFADLTAMQSQDSARQAALTLHAMSGADRGWVMAQMPEAQQKQLQALLEELTAMEIPADLALLRLASHVAPADKQTLNSALSPTLNAAAKAMGEAGVATEISDGEYFQMLEGASIGGLVAVLQNEPALLTARLLSIQTWPWHQAVLDGFPQIKRQQVLKCLEQAAAKETAPRLAAVLLSTLRRRCEPTKQADLTADRSDQGTRPAQPVRPTWLARLMARKS